MAEPIFTNFILDKMKKMTLSETQIMDVWNNGNRITLSSGADALVRKYYDSEIGVIYTRDKDTGNYVLINCWTRARR